jgi:hypothetical protein
VTVGRALWCALTQNKVAAVLVVVVLIALSVVAERVMTHGYSFRIQWSPQGRVELAPPATGASVGSSR